MVEFYTHETQEQKQVELSDIAHAVNVTYYQDSNGNFIIRQTEEDISFLLEPEKIADIAGKVGRSSFVKNPTTLMMPEQKYSELLIMYRALTDAVSKAEETKQEYERAKENLGFDVDRLSNTQFLQLSSKDYVKWMEGLRAGYPEFAEKENNYLKAKSNIERAKEESFLYLCEIFNVPFATEIKTARRS